MERESESNTVRTAQTPDVNGKKQDELAAVPPRS
jgi:hypothetical protein